MDPRLPQRPSGPDRPSQGVGQGAEYDFLGQIERDKAEAIQWVSRKDQKDYLKQNGYQQVHAIGLPFGYLPQDRVARVPGSLLVMPPHGHDSHGPDDPLAREYAAQIALKSKAFSEMYVCLAADDYARNSGGAPSRNTAYR